MIAVGDINQIAHQSFESLSDDKLGLSRPFASPQLKLEYLSQLKQNLTTLTEQANIIEFLNQLQEEPPSMLKPIIAVIRANPYSINDSYTYNDDHIKDSSGNKITTNLTDHAAYQAIVNTQIRNKLINLQAEIANINAFVDAGKKLETDARSLVAIINRAYHEGLENSSRVELQKLSEAVSSLNTLFGDAPLTSEQSDQKSYIQNSLDFFITHKIDVVRKHIQARATDLRDKLQKTAKALKELIDHKDLSRAEYNDAVKGIQILGRADNSDPDKKDLIEKVTDFYKEQIERLRPTLNIECREWVIKQLPKEANIVNKYLHGDACSISELENILVLYKDARAVGAVDNFSKQFNINDHANFATELEKKIEVQKAVELLVEAYNNRNSDDYKKAKCYNDPGAIPRLEAVLKQLSTTPLDATNKVYTAFKVAMNLLELTNDRLDNDYVKPIEKAINGLKIDDKQSFKRMFTVYDRKDNNWLRFNLLPTGELQCFRFNGRNWQAGNINFVDGKATWDVWDHSQETSYRIEYTESKAASAQPSALTRRSDTDGHVLTEKLIIDPTHASTWVPLQLTRPSEHEIFSRTAPASLKPERAQSLGKSAAVNILRDKTTESFEKFNTTFGDQAGSMILQALTDSNLSLVELEKQVATNVPAGTVLSDDQISERRILFRRLYGLARGQQLVQDGAGREYLPSKPPYFNPIDFLNEAIPTEWIRQQVIDHIVDLTQAKLIANKFQNAIIAAISNPAQLTAPQYQDLLSAARLLLCGKENLLACGITDGVMQQLNQLAPADRNSLQSKMLQTLTANPSPFNLLRELMEEFKDRGLEKDCSIPANGKLTFELTPENDNAALKKLKELQAEWQTDLDDSIREKIHSRAVEIMADNVMSLYNQFVSAIAIIAIGHLEAEHKNANRKLKSLLALLPDDAPSVKLFITRFNLLRDEKLDIAAITTKEALIKALETHLTTIYNDRKNKLTRAGADTNLNLMQHRAYMQDLTKNFSDHHGKPLEFRDNHDRSAKILQLGDLIITQTQTQCSISVHHTPNPMDPKAQPRELTEADLEAVFKPLFKTWAEHGVNVKRVWGNEEQKDFLRKLAWDAGLTVEGEAAPNPRLSPR